uniref:Putative D-mannonate dehydrogenase n=1 Tax=uncultured bacterium contig00060 TaxID=1181543 RepID=A0A806K0H2_9BACT|nr:putative D-mannonate dehydrogenase [uncultured bacterium contig00060]
MEKTYIAYGNADKKIDDSELEELFSDALANALSDIKISGSVIIVPPDITRLPSRAGLLTEIAAKQLTDRLGLVLPALGTHMAMKDGEISRMFGKTPKDKFGIHDWRNDITELGRLEAEWVEKTTEGAVCYDWPVQINKLLRVDGPGSGGFSLIISIGQVVPHEVAGMANHAKNIFVGLGGKEAIDKSHFAGAAYGMERIMGRTDNPVRSLFDEGMFRFENLMPPVLWVLTVIGTEKDGSTVTHGLFIGFGRECFEKAASLSRKINVNHVNEQVNKVVVYLEPDEYRTTWLGNKAIYRTRMAMADGGEILILAPALERFGEDVEVDRLIRKYGYRSREEIISMVKTDKELADNLSIAAHLIHGSSEGRFSVRYCPGEKLSRNETESAGFQWGDLKEARKRYDINKLSAGWNTPADGEKIYFVPNPALVLLV